MSMMTAMIWTLIALMAGGMVALLADSRAGRRDLRLEMRQDIGELRDRVQVLAERQAEMNGRLDVVAAMAHTHSE